MTLRTIAHRLVCPSGASIEGLRPSLDELPDDRRELLAAEWTKVLSERHWHRPYLQD